MNYTIKYRHGKYADWVLGTKLKDYFDDHPNEDVINFQAEI
jgi:hypothetical protein